MTATSRRRVIEGALTLLLALGAGCYKPKLNNFGFACDSRAAKPCPDGYFCRNGFCDDGSGGTPPAGSGSDGGGDDLAMSSGGSGGGGSGGGGGGNPQPDLAMSMQDLALPVQDLAQPPDLTQVSTCAHPICTTGGKLTKSCDPCVSQICSSLNDPSCCSVTWDSICVSEVGSICGQTCP